jgi:hypothetical protein
MPGVRDGRRAAVDNETNTPIVAADRVLRLVD